MTQTELPRLLSERLRRPLPGPMIGSRFAPQPHPHAYYELPADAPKAAAVLILLYPNEGRWHVPFIVRAEDRTVHAGQVSLPGGAIEADETSAEAAVRELHEEIGADDCTIELLGTLSPWHVYASNYLVTPWIGVTKNTPTFRPNPGEVAEVLEIPLAHLTTPQNLLRRRRTHLGKTYMAPYFAWREYRIWGATCMILGEFVTLIEEISRE